MFDLDAEQCTLSCMFLAGADLVQFAKIRSAIWRDAFFQPDHRIIFETLCEIVDGNKPVEIPYILAAVKAKGVLEEIGGIEYLAKVIGSHFTAVQGPHYAAIVADQACRREASEVGRKLMERVTQPGDIRKLLHKVIVRLHQLETSGRTLSISTLGDAVEAFMLQKEAGEATHLMTGIHSLDEFRGIFCLGKYTIIAGRPSMGKSTAVRWLLREFARSLPVGLIAVEEDNHKISGNYLSAESSIENDYVAYGTWNAQDWSRLAHAAGELTKIPYVLTDSAFDIQDICAAFETMAIQHKCQVIAIDHLHLIKGDRNSETRERELTQISGELKSLAKKHNVCCITAAQLSRPKDGKFPDPPSLTDLRGSGGIEEHADAAIMLHRQDYYHRNDTNFMPDFRCEWHVTKNRNGKVGELCLRAELKYQRYTTIDPFS